MSHLVAIRWMAARRRLAVLSIVTSVTFGAAMASAAPQVSITSSVSPQSGTLADNYAVTIDISISGQNGYDRISAPKFSDFSLIDQSTRQSTQWQFDPARGQEIRNIVQYRYVLSPKRPGKLKIEPAEIIVAGKKHSSDSLTVNVQDSGTPSTPIPPHVNPPQSNLSANIVLECSVDKRKIVVGEEIVATWTLYVSNDDEIRQYRSVTEPQTDGFWVEPLAQPSRFSYSDVVRGGRHFIAAVVLKKALFPHRTGDLVIGSLGAEIELLGALAPVELKSAPVTVSVVDAPSSDRPPSFVSSNVGTFSIDATASPTNLVGGEPSVLTVTIKGRGNIRGVRIPDLDRLAQSMSAFEVFPPQVNENVSPVGDVIAGSRTVTYRLKPLKNGTFQIPALALGYFDSARGVYAVTQTSPISLTATQTPPRPPDAATASDRVVVAPPQLFGHVYGAKLSQRTAGRLHRRALFWLLFFAPPIAYVGVLLLDGVWAKAKRETPKARTKKAASEAKRALSACERLVKSGEAAPFFGELSRVLVAYVAQRLGQPLAGAPREAIREAMLAGGCAEPIVGTFERELESHDFARFAPGSVAHEEMRSALKRARTLLAELERSWDRAEPMEEPT